MQTEQAELHFRQGSSDKVYHLQLENADNKWSVQAQWGRRGSALQSDVKASGTTSEEAKRVYDRILREKVGLSMAIGRSSLDCLPRKNTRVIRRNCRHPSRSRRRCSWHRMCLGGSSRNLTDGVSPYERPMENIPASTNSAKSFPSIPAWPGR
jgi:predicted DNA-binding WGR domain protein